MAPLAFSFEGIKVNIYHEDHNPIHIHALYGDQEAVYELEIMNGKLIESHVRDLSKQLPPAQDKKVRKF